MLRAWEQVYMDSYKKSMHLIEHVCAHQHRSDSPSDPAQGAPCKVRRVRPEDYQLSRGEAIEQHYRHYRSLSLEIGFTSIPWLITICRQRVSVGERKSGRKSEKEDEYDGKWGKGRKSASGGGWRIWEREGRVHLVLSMNISWRLHSNLPGGILFIDI